MLKSFLKYEHAHLAGNKVKSQKEGYSYNERLFSGGIRTQFHLARFQWLAKNIQRLNCPTDAVLELGCFDGKLIHYLPHRPSRYVGYDANWEGGLDLAKKNWAGVPQYTFFKASTPEDIQLGANEKFSFCVAMETLEHVPPQLVEGYLAKIAQHLDGYFFITVPNEKHLVFLVKWLAKKLFSKDAEKYTFSEIINAFLGRMHLVSRREHKGFDYDSFLKDVEKYFEVIHVSGHPFGFLPRSLCFGIGIIAKSKTKLLREISTQNAPSPSTSSDTKHP